MLVLVHNKHLSRIDRSDEVKWGLLYLWGEGGIFFKNEVIPVNLLLSPKLLRIS